MKWGKAYADQLFPTRSEKAGHIAGSLISRFAGKERYAKGQGRKSFRPCPLYRSETTGYAGQLFRMVMNSSPVMVSCS